MSSSVLRGASRLTKTTHVFAVHTIPLKCDVYAAEDYPATSPIFLYFHPGGLVCGSRSCVPPWLVQVCYKNKWPLVSASYRMLPQAKASGLLDDARAAYKFATQWGVKSNGPSTERKAIVGGGSAGFFMASLTAHHLTPPPIALMSITGITTFRHHFFNSSVLLTPEPIVEAQMAHHLSAPESVGTTSANDPRVFDLDKLLPDGAKNTKFNPPIVPISEDGNADEFPRGCLYDYYLYRNEFVDLVGDIDPGYEWAKSGDSKDRIGAWPPTTIIQGDADPDVDLAVSTHMVDCLGEDKVKLFLAKGQDHLFEATRFLEDNVDGMDAVRQAVANLESDVVRAL
ncbi:endomembrane protein 70-like protein [Colletotrichum truncatum]|uniref:Endomembrane protein 70-like protein n=1 Tax=Colletotrichum truncatum TaxID=5467 RepID=A0ACC3ZLT8_COLTU|nr:endomembrane protein 70-like protein [Colletotrichum truncatum]KAF6783985.1 endomembrane protein 70-like protein [Colletotrichum truncatum]